MVCDLKRHMAHAGLGSLTHDHMAHVYTGLPRRLQKKFSEQVVANAAHHGYFRTQPCALERLVCAFSAGSHVEGVAVNGLRGFWNALRGGDHIHDKAAND